MEVFAPRYREAVEIILGETPPGVPEEELCEAESRVGKLPAALREYYRVAGNVGPIGRVPNGIRSPSKLSVEKGILEFGGTNWGITTYGLKTSDMDLADRTVYLLTDEDWLSDDAPGGWQPTDCSLSEFLFRHLYWQAATGRPLKHAGCATLAESDTAMLIEEWPLVLGDAGADMSCYARNGQVLLLHVGTTDNCLQAAARTEADRVAIDSLIPCYWEVVEDRK